MNQNFKSMTLIGCVIVAFLLTTEFAFSQTVNTFFSDMANQTQTGGSGVKLLAGRVLGIILIIVLAIAIATIWLKPEYSKTLGVSFIVGLIIYWACVQMGWLAV